jgi:flagellin
MGLVVNTNTQSLFAQRALRNNTAGLKANIERLSTGFRINRASDDAAGLSISSKLTTSIRGIEKAKQNAGDGISLIQTAEGGLGVIQENLQRIRELVVQGKNGTNGPSEADALQREINERIRNISDIANATKFNGQDLLINATDKTLQTGAENGQVTTIELTGGLQANMGINLNISYEKTGTNSDFGSLVEGITDVVFANKGLHNIHLGVTGMNVQSLDKTLDPATGQNVTVSVNHLDKMIDNISRMRSYLGAKQNALESKIEYLDIARENAEASRSRIQDVDVAQESSVLVKNQILQQTASAMLAQANSQPQIALSLLPQ